MKQPNLDTIQNILFLELRPWLNRTTPEAKYKQLHEGLIKAHFSYQPMYEPVFPKPLTAKRKYYHALIENEVIEYLSDLNTEILAAQIINEKKYWVHTALTKVLSQKLRDISEIIESFNFSLSNLTSKSVNDNIKDDTYIIQYLRLQLSRAYLEIQNLYQEYLKDEPLSFQELNEKYFSEALPDSHLKEASKIKLHTSGSQIISKQHDALFKTKAYDFRPAKGKNILDFKTVVKNPDRFSRFEEKLRINEFIDDDYNFQNKHGQIQELAAIFQTLIQKGYFNERKFPGSKVIKDVEFRKFLDHRYGSNTDRQFRNWGNNADELAAFVSDKYWIDSLPVC